MSEARLERIEDLLGQLVGMVEIVVKNQREMKSDIAEMKSDIFIIKSDIKMINTQSDRIEN
jgi:hypothetical protein